MKNFNEVKANVSRVVFSVLGVLALAACQPVLGTVTPEVTPTPTALTSPPPTDIPPSTPTPFAGYTCDMLMATPGPDGTGAGIGYGKFYNDDPTKPIICETDPVTGKGTLTHP